MSSYGGKILKGAGIVFLMSVFSAISSFVVKIILSRFFDVSEVGLFFAVLTTVNLFFIFKDMGMGKTVQRYLPMYISSKDTQKASFLCTFVIFFSIASSLVFGSIILLFSDLLAESYFKDNLATSLILIFVVYLILTKLLLIVSNIYLSLHEVFVAKFLLALKEILAPILLLFFFGHGILGAGYAYILGTALCIPIALYYFPKEFLLHKFTMQWTEIKKYIKFGLPLVFAELVVKPGKYFDIIFLTAFTSLGEVGIYSLVYYLPLATLRISNAFANVLMPRISQMETENFQGIRSIFQGITHHVSWTIVACSIVFISFSREIIEIAYGLDYVSGYMVMTIVSTSLVFQGISVLNISALNGLGYSGKVGKILGISSVLNILLNAILIPLTGIEGAATATALQYAITFFLTQHQLKAQTKIELDWNSFIKLIFVAVITVASIIFMKGFLNGLFGMGLSLIIGGTIYVIVSSILKIVDIKDLYTRIRKMISRT